MANRTALVRSILNEIACQPFEYGSTDCCQFVAQVIEALTGERPGAEWEYSTEARADAIIDAHGGLADFITSYLGAPIDIDDLEDGDPVLIQVGNYELMGVMFNRAPWLKAKNGTLPVNPRLIKTGWHITWRN